MKPLEAAVNSHHGRRLQLNQLGVVYRQWGSSTGQVRLREGHGSPMPTTLPQCWCWAFITSLYRRGIQRVPCPCMNFYLALTPQGDAAWQMGDRNQAAQACGPRPGRTQHEIIPHPAGLPHGFRALSGLHGGATVAQAQNAGWATGELPKVIYRARKGGSRRSQRER